MVNETAVVKTPQRSVRRRQGTKPGIRTTELWGSAAALAAALVAGLEADDRWVKIAALGAFAILGSVLGTAYIWSRTRVKARPEA